MKTSNLFIGVLLVLPLCAWPRVLAQTDNQVYFKSGPDTPGEQMVSGDFKVVAFFVTPGQKTNLYKGYSTTFTGAASFHFGVDRSGTGETADWWNQHIDSPSTTFNHAPGKLNFAMQGRLTLHAIGGTAGENGATLVFDNAFLAQGHSRTSNNWWFGIKGAKQVPGGSNQISAVTADGARTVTFLRGGNSVDTVEVISF